jgi:hypothetical protein
MLIFLFTTPFSVVTKDSHIHINDAKPVASGKTTVLSEMLQNKGGAKVIFCCDHY